MPRRSRANQRRVPWWTEETSVTAEGFRSGILWLPTSAASAVRGGPAGLRQSPTPLVPQQPSSPFPQSLYLNGSRYSTARAELPDGVPSCIMESFLCTSSASVGSSFAGLEQKVEGVLWYSPNFFLLIFCFSLICCDFL